LIGSDDFNRADNDSLGSLWVEKSGDFDIDTNTLITAMTGVCLTSLRQANPRSSGYHYQVLVDLVQTATEWALICKYTDANNFDWIHFYISGTDVLPRFYQRAGGVDTMIMDITTHPAGVGFPITGTDNIQIEMCYSEVGWTVESGDESSRWTTCDVSPASSLPADTAVGFVGFLYGDFDNFFYYYHRLSNLPCPVCDCSCENPDDDSDYACMPETLTMTLRPTAPFTDPYGGCAAGSDVVINLYQSYPSGVAALTTPTYDPSPRKVEWYSDILYFPDRGIELWFLLVCDAGEFRLHQLLYPGDFPTIGSGSGVVEWLGTPYGTYQLPDVTECNPINMHFDVLRVTNHDDGVSIPYCDTLPDLDYEIFITS